MLTKDEIEEVFQSVANDDPEVHLRFAAAVIAAHTAKVPGDVEPVAFMFQHSETGRIAFVDAWQKENGWALANPRYSEVGTMHGASTVASLTAQRDQALARVAELEKDAARYQKLLDLWNGRDMRELFGIEDFAAIDAAPQPQQEQSK